MNLVKNSYLGVAIGVAVLLPQSAATQEWSAAQKEVWAAIADYGGPTP